MTTREESSDRPTFSGASVFNTGGQRLNELDLDSYQAPKSIADMTDDDWEQAAAALRAFDAGQR
ncbi:hypothetical protein [Amycolatopsis sp. NPDC051128]|uniref:hypothetical protein n=1 Tax=Amycolatopsis sp. NPDC051128 TaxID=3155412 RepID=UPI003430EE9C